jgi:hypothetical protein
MTCDCGFPGVDRSHRYHRLSVCHRHYRRIRGLLSDSSLSFADIGDRLGITRERVRQIAQKLGMTSGRQRREQRALHQRIPAWQERKGYRELIAKGKEFGYTVTPSRVDSPEGWRFQARIVVINGWRAQQNAIIETCWPGRNFLLTARWGFVIFENCLLTSDFGLSTPTGVNTTNGCENRTPLA